MKSSAPKISVIIPTYKPKEYLWECLSSLKRQTLPPSQFEIIVILNGCKDPYITQIRDYVTFLDLNIRLFQTNQGGVSNARNIGLDNADGEYITFIDDDDYVSESYLEELLKCSSDSCVGLSNGVVLDDETKTLREKCSYGDAFKRLSSVSSPSLFRARVFFNGPVLKLIHRHIIGARRFDTRFANGEDNLMMFLISNRIKSISFTSKNAIYYRRIRSESATTRRRGFLQKFKNSIKIMCQYTVYFAKKPHEYNIIFVASRYAAEIKSIFV